jgi:two-component system chemotaxis response regulator CheB
LSGTATAAARLAGVRRDDPYRIMVVDDSAVIRGLLTRTLEAEPDFRVVVTASNGQMAISAAKREAVELVVLDIEMPVMDGLTALPQLLAVRPDLKVVIASTLTRRGADISLKALAQGAADYVTKPGASVLTAADAFRHELVAKLRALGEARRRAAGAPRPSPAAAKSAGPKSPAPRGPAAAPQLRPLPAEVPEVLAIGSSTGGPQALFRVLGALRGSVRQPIFVTQHMPATFTTILAEHLAKASGRPASEGVDGEPVCDGRIYVAPGDFHLTVVPGEGGRKLVRVVKSAPENFCRPSVDPMLRSLADAYGRRVLCTILTGMGHDGLAGCRAVLAAGGAVVAQDEATSVVWGMPGAVATAGLCSAVLPLDEIGPLLHRLATRSAP